MINNWKLFTVIFMSLVLLILCYFTLDCLTLSDNFQQLKYQHQPHQHQHQLYHEDNDKVENKTRKVKILIDKEDDLKGITIPSDYVVYYFPEKCPDYKSGYFLIDLSNDLEKYYIPEDNHLIIINKNHIWTKEPDFLYWKYIPN